MGAGKSTLGAEIATRLGRRLVDLDRELERAAGQAIPELFEQRGEVEFRILEAEATLSALTVFLDVDPDTAWGRVRRSGRPLARDEGQCRALYDKRQSLYREVADVT